MDSLTHLILPIILSKKQQILLFQRQVLWWPSLTFVMEALLQRIVDTQTGKGESLASLPEYHFFRERYKRGGVTKFVARPLATDMADLMRQTQLLAEQVIPLAHN